jgi:hypothetical protein
VAGDNLENRTEVTCIATGELRGTFAAFRTNGRPQWNPL